MASTVGPMAVSSANISGSPAALTCDQAIEQLGDSVAIYLDGGPLSDASGAPSTIVDFTQNEDGQVLRRGAISVETLRETAPNLLDVNESSNGALENQDEARASNGSGSSPAAGG